MAGEKSTAYANALLLQIFQNTAFSGISAAGANANLYLSFHTADPTASGNQSTSEVAWGSYARQAVVRSSAGWTVTGNTVTLAAGVTVVFPTVTGTGGSATYVGVGTLVSGTGVLLYACPITGGITVAVGNAPAISSITITES